jgi:hypothetical protein
MNKYLKSFKKCSTLLLAIFMLATIISPSVFASQTGAITGKFGTTTAPVVTEILIHNAAAEALPTTTTVVPASLTPQQEYDIKVTVTDTDTIDELNNLVVKLWHDSDGNAHVESDFNSKTADTQTAAIITWTRSGNTAALTPGDTTWSLVGSTLPTAFEGTSFTFVFRVKIGKVATATTDNAKWQVAAKATDAGSLNGYRAYNVSETYGLPMDWYGETTVPQDHEVVWGSLTSGINFNADNAKQRVFSGVDSNVISFIANGNYGEQVKAATSWTKVGGGDPVIRNADAEAENTFALAVDVVDTYDAGTAKTLSASADFSTTQPRTTGVQTTEAGQNKDDYYMFIKLNSSFPTGSVYSGAITFGIYNR